MAGAQCWRCPLRGKRPVPPEGPHDPELVVVGEGPGANEEKAGRPFIGPSGIALDDILRKAGVKRERIWITNAVLCRADTPGVQGSKRYDFKTFLAYLRKENAAAKAGERARAKVERRKPDYSQVLEHSSPLECCGTRLWSELMHFEQVAVQRGDVNGLVVVPVGNFAALAVTGKQGIMKLRGSPLQPSSAAVVKLPQ